MCKVPACRKTFFLVPFLLLCCRHHGTSLPDDVATQKTRHTNQFGVEAAALMAPTPTRMLVLTSSEGYHQLPGTQPFLFLHRSQLTTNPQYWLTCHDLNGRQRLPWCPTPSASTDNSPPECCRIVVCSSTRSGEPWRPWEDGSRHGQWGMVLLALATFNLAKSHITTHNNQSIRPNQWGGDNDISVKYKVPSSRH
jgi:hypothetical protein